MIQVHPSDLLGRICASPVLSAFNFHLQMSVCIMLAISISPTAVGEEEAAVNMDLLPSLELMVIFTVQALWL